MEQIGGKENDYLFGSNGVDFLFGGAGNDWLLGNAGDDILRGQNGNDFLIGHAGNDQLFGGEGDDHMEGNEGNDVLYGQNGNDGMHGQDGNDQLFGGEGDDLITGGIGNDRLVGGDGNDKLYGGLGDDILEFDGQHDDIDLIADFSGNNTAIYSNTVNELEFFRGDDLGFVESIFANALHQYVPDANDLIVQGVSNSGNASDDFQIYQDYFAGDVEGAGFHTINTEDASLGFADVLAIV